METTRERFDRNVKAKAGIGDPFTLEDVARSLQVDPRELRSSWLTPFIKSDTIRKVGTQPSKVKSNRGRHISLWQGTYYLELEAQEEAEKERLAKEYAATMSAPFAMTAKDAELLDVLLAC